MSELRLKRVESLLRDLVSSLIIKGKVKDPRVSTLLTITDVKVSADLSYAKLYISSFESDQKMNTAVEALNHAAGHIQKHISKELRMRETPKLRFYPDDSIERGFNVNEKIEKLEISSDED